MDVLPDGYSLIELVFAICLMTTLTGMALPEFQGAIDDARAAGAARYLVSRVQQARFEAASRSANVALQFVPGPNGYSYAAYGDGNGDGVRTQDIRSGVDVRLGPSEYLSDNFPGVTFDVLPGLPPVEPGTPAPGADPVKLGVANLLSFSAVGTSSTGSLYIRGRGTTQYAIRVFGGTGRTRLFKFNARSRTWTAQ
jgi:type II secretory pathway pseudopilin PulG